MKFFVKYLVGLVSVILFMCLPKSMVEAQTGDGRYGSLYQGEKVLVDKEIPSDRITANKFYAASDIEKISVETISGQVTDKSTGETLPGVNILVKGTSTGASTDSDGNYELMVESLQDTLVVSFVGYKTQQVPIGGRTEIDVALQTQAISGEEMVVVGYGEQKKENLTGSIEQIGAEEIEKQPSILPSAALMGKAAGVTVIQNSGQPGQNGGDIQIRGIGTLSNSNALVLIDGVEGNLDDISTADIKDITVLKDAAAASIYGSRAANGVVLVTTKRGGKGEIKINYNSLYGWNSPTRQPEYVDAGRYMELENLGATNLGKQPIWSMEYIQRWKKNHKTDPDNYPNTDWVSAVFSKAPAFQQKQHLSVSGGRENVQYLASLNYSQENGTIPNFKFKNYSIRVNTDVKASEHLDLKFDLNVIKEDRNRPSQSLSLLSRQAFRVPPIYAARYTTGGYGLGWDGRNPVAYAEAGGFRSDEKYQIRGRIKARYHPIDNLEFNLMYAPDYGSNFYKKMEKQYHVYDPNSGDLIHTEPLKNDLLENFEKNFTHNLNFTTTYQLDLATHSFKITGGSEIIDYQEDFFNAFRDNFLLQDFTELDAANSANQQNSGNSTSYSLQSFFGRFNYNYKTKYLFEANIRYDGSSRFAEDVRWGVFPSFSAGWNIANESFMEPLGSISNFKLRASWGKLGNQNIAGNFPYIAGINLNQEFIFDDTPTPGTAQLSLANPDITWEETTNFDIGSDIGLFDNRINFTFDWYKRTTKDILLQIPIPDLVGLGAPFQNAGKVENTGWEVETGYKGDIGEDFSFGLSLNISNNHNEVTYLKDAGPFVQGNTITKKGYPINSIYGYVADGLFNSQEEIDNHATQTGRIAPGDIKYQDLNKDGIINADDRTIIGNPFPKFNYGLTINASYKGFDFNALLQGIGKRDVLLQNVAVWAFYNAGKITKWQADNFWTSQNKNDDYPRLTQTSAHNNFKSSDYWVYNAAYLRLRNLQIGYTLPTKWTSQINIRSARIFFTGQNLLTMFDTLPQGVDPNVPSGTNGAYFPVNRLIAGGIEIKF